MPTLAVAHAQYWSRGPAGPPPPPPGQGLSQFGLWQAAVITYSLLLFLLIGH